MRVEPVDQGMEIRGERECQQCGTRWSYYEHGEITCPECGSIRSVGLDDPTAHTTATASFDLSDVRQDIDTVPLREVAGEAATVAAEYLREVGFIHAGALQPLDDETVAAAELRRVGTTVARLMHPTADEEWYLLTLLRGADSGDRPAPADVPESFHPERGLAIERVVDIYLSDLRRLRGDGDPALGRALSTLGTRRTRLGALDGDVDPRESEQLLLATRDLGRYWREGDETALVRATERFDDGEGVGT